MVAVNRSTSARELAVMVSLALEDAGITAVLSGGGAVTLYTQNEYESRDLDFVTNAATDAIGRAIEPLGFSRIPGARQFEHPDSDLYVEFPPGPLSFGETVIANDDATVLQTEFGPLRIITPTQSVMDRLSAYVHWNDNQSFDQAVLVAQRQTVAWPDLYEWARLEGMRPEVIETLRRRVEGL